MKKWRFVNSGAVKGSLNMGYDLAVLESVSSKSDSPMLRIYQWDNPTVTSGYFQNLYNEVDVRACRENGIDIIKRITGGGTVLHNREITYSLVLPVDNPVIKGKDILDVFKEICTPIMKTIDSYGPVTSFKPLNDIHISGRKISGNAQKIMGNALLQHGTIILDLEDSEISKFLLKPKTSVTSLREHIGDIVLTKEFYDDFAHRMKKNFGQHFRINFIDKGFSSQESMDAFKAAEQMFRPLSEQQIEKIVEAGL